VLRFLRKPAVCDTQYAIRNTFFPSRITHHAPRPSSAFTLIEIMVVVGIMGLILLTGIPLVYKVWHKEPMRQALSDVIEVLSNARARAILQGHDVAVIFHPRDRTYEIEGSGGAAAGSGKVQVGLALGAGGGTHARFPDEVMIEMLDVNLSEYKDQERARVVFHPGGTCDEMTLILRGAGWWRRIDLEITTGIPSVRDKLF
jgi:prepilin-type N-terminal cleavage/methylation domain-containing protein